MRTRGCSKLVADLSLDKDMLQLERNFGIDHSPTFECDGSDMEVSA
jgi:hypothetical protein